MITKTLKKNLATIYAIICFVFTLIRVNNNSFWGDEAWTIYFSKMSVWGFVKGTASDVHPPLYYFIVWIFTKVLGYEAYVYRLVSVVAFACMLIVAIIYIKKYYGQCAAILFITFLTFLGTTRTQNLEARMYAWAILFVCMSYILLKKILEKNELIYYAWFAFFVLSAAYTHYYALVSVAFLCAGLIIYSIVHRGYLRNTVITGAAIVVLYAPWMIVLLRTFNKTKEDYWIKTIPTLMECMRYVFKSVTALEVVLLIILVVLIVIYVASRVLSSKYINNITMSTPEEKDIWWVIIGIAAVLLTAVTGILVSEVFRPMFQVKYMYPCVAIAWIILIECISKVQRHEYIFITLAIITFLVCINGYVNLINSDKADHIHVQTTVAEINKEINDDALVIIENDCTSYKMLLYYYPGNENEEVMDVVDFDFSSSSYDDFWIVTNLLYDEDKIKNINNLGIGTVDLYISDGMIGNRTVNIYHCYK